MTCGGSSNLVIEQSLTGSGTKNKDLSVGGGNLWDMVIRNTAIVQETGERTTFLVALMHGIKLESLLQRVKHEANKRQGSKATV